MRLDKFLKVSRLIKRPAKASLSVKAGDVIEIQFGAKAVKVEVLSVQETVKKDDAAELYRYV